MITVYQWIVENWQLMIAIGVLVFILPLTGSITQTIRAAKKGLKEAVTPLGFLIFLGLGYVAYLIWLSISETL